MWGRSVWARSPYENFFRQFFFPPLCVYLVFGNDYIYFFGRVLSVDFFSFKNIMLWLPPPPLQCLIFYYYYYCNLQMPIKKIFAQLTTWIICTATKVNFRSELFPNYYFRFSHFSEHICNLLLCLRTKSFFSSSFRCFLCFFGKKGSCFRMRPL